MAAGEFMELDDLITVCNHFSSQLRDFEPSTVDG